jgi:[ribosomal protein S18]-alanine N-acetyltransferase
MMSKLFDPKTDDAARLAAWHAASFTDAWSADFIRDLLNGPGVFALVQGKGFILARAAGREGEILTLAVAPEGRRQGTGRALVRDAASHVRQLGASMLFLEVAADNKPALGLYLGLGFEKVGARKAYYGGRDAEVLRAALPLPNPGNFA